MENEPSDAIPPLTYEKFHMFFFYFLKASLKENCLLMTYERLTLWANVPGALP